MVKNDNIFVKIQIEKDRHSGNLLLNIHFNKDAPNFSTDNNDISWSPTFEEINFIEETFEMISNCKSHNTLHRDKIKNYESSLPLEKETEGPPEVETETKTETFEHEKTDDAENIPSPTTKPEYNDDERKIFVQANEETIDEVLKRRTGVIDDGLIVEADEKTILDKVLKQKKRKR